MEKLRFKKEQELFNFLKEKHLPNLIATDDVCRWDAETDGYIIELKCRTAHYEDIMFERFKFEEMIKEAKRRGVVPLQIVSTPKAIYVYDLSLLTDIVKWEKRMMKKTTSFNDNRIVEKQLCNISVGYAKVLKYDS